MGHSARWFQNNRQLDPGELVGTAANGTSPLGNEINGIIISNNASNNTTGGTNTGQGNTIAFNVAAGVLVQSGTGDSIVSNSIYSNDLGISLNGSANDLISPPTLLTAVVDATTHTIYIQGTYTSWRTRRC